MLPDSDGDGEIDVRELDSTIRLYKRKKKAGQLQSWHGHLDAQQDPVFPNWLINRDDFRHIFSRYSAQKVMVNCRSYHRRHEPLELTSSVCSSAPLMNFVSLCNLEAYINRRVFAAADASIIAVTGNEM